MKKNKPKNKKKCLIENLKKKKFCHFIQKWKFQKIFRTQILFWVSSTWFPRPFPKMTKTRNVSERWNSRSSYKHRKIAERECKCKRIKNVFLVNVKSRRQNWNSEKCEHEQVVANDSFIKLRQCGYGSFFFFSSKSSTKSQSFWNSLSALRNCYETRAYFRATNEPFFSSGKPFGLRRFSLGSSIFTQKAKKKRPNIFPFFSLLIPDRPNELRTRTDIVNFTEPFRPVSFSRVAGACEKFPSWLVRDFHIFVYPRFKIFFAFYSIIYLETEFSCKINSDSLKINSISKIRVILDWRAELNGLPRSESSAKKSEDDFVQKHNPKWNSLEKKRH